MNLLFWRTPLSAADENSVKRAGNRTAAHIENLFAAHERGGIPVTKVTDELLSTPLFKADIFRRSEDGIYRIIKKHPQIRRVFLNGIQEKLPPNFRVSLSIHPIFSTLTAKIV